MKNRENKNKKRRFGISAFPIIVLCFILALAVYHFIFGNPSNFMNNDPNNHPYRVICWERYIRVV